MYTMNRGNTTLREQKTRDREKQTFRVLTMVATTPNRNVVVTAPRITLYHTSPPELNYAQRLSR